MAAALLYTTCKSHKDVAREDWVLGFEYCATPEASAIRVAYVLSERGGCFIDQQVQVIMACKFDRFTLHDMLTLGARDLLNHSHPSWAGGNEARGLLVLDIEIDNKGNLSVQERGRTELKNRSQDERSVTTAISSLQSSSNLKIHCSSFLNITIPELSQSFCHLLQEETESSHSLLTVAAALLIKAASIILPTRDCASVAFGFEGDGEATKVEIVAVEDDRGYSISEETFLFTWKPDGTQSIGWFLTESISRYLDEVLPEWRREMGASGFATLSISWNEAGELAAVARGRAQVWTCTDRLLPPSK